MIISKTVPVRINNKWISYYLDKGYTLPMKPAGQSTKYATGKDYVYDTSKTIDVKVEDLPPKSSARVSVKCDVCGKIHELRYADYTKSVNNYGYYACSRCSLDKIKKTNLERYGTMFPSQTEEFRNKVKETSIKKWGYVSNLSSPIVREQIKQTCNKKYGGNAPANDPKVMEKTRQTFMQKYGGDCSSHVPEIQNKIAQSLYNHQVVNTSLQQLYLHNLYGGELNYPIGHYNVDICFDKEKLIVEYDGGGHDLSIKYGTYTAEEFEQREIRRSFALKRKGYKIIYLISQTDKLPSDGKLFEMLNMSKEYFKKYPEHSWIKWCIDDNVYTNAEHKEGLPYDFGELRKIVKTAS